MIIEKNNLQSARLASDVLIAGKIAILPTDTVYGFSGIVSKEFACEKKIATIKGRDEGKPLIQLIAKPSDIFLYTDENVPRKLLSYWPGALTIIVKNKTASTTAFRCPGDEWLRNVIQFCDAPIFSTSVNKSGEPVLDEIDNIVSTFQNDVSLIVSDGNKKNALPSTIVKFENGITSLVRQGAVKVNV